MSAAGLPPDADLLAAEFAFGLLEGNDRTTAEARLASDPAFAAAHDRWLTHAVALADGGEEAPRPAVWDGLCSQLAANDAEPPAARDGALKVWRWATLAAMLAATIFAALAMERTARPPRIVQVERPVRPPLVAVLTGADAHAVLAVSFDRASGHLTAVPRRIATGSRVAELWVIPAGGKPRAIGVIPVDQPSWRLVPNELRPDVTSTALLAVSLEPVGGSPTGQPTGPVILSGKGALAS